MGDEENEAEKLAGTRLKWMFVSASALLVLLLGTYLLLSA